MLRASVPQGLQIATKYAEASTASYSFDVEKVCRMVEILFTQTEVKRKKFFFSVN